MSQFNFLTTEEQETYCLEIAQAMTVLFGIPHEDAVARINKQWENVSPKTGEWVFHETPDYWATWIFFGQNQWRSLEPVATTTLARIERKLNLILDHLGIEYSNVNTGVLALLGQGKKLEAIGLYQKEFGVGLKQAREIVEEMQNRLAEEQNTEQGI